jgi:hypothetical protein
MQPVFYTDKSAVIMGHTSMGFKLFYLIKETAMLKCIGTDQEYNPDTHFVTYTIEKSDKTRSYVLQFVQGENESKGKEEFHCYSLQDPSPHSGQERNFERRYRIINEDDLLNKLAQEGTRYTMHILPKQNYLLQRIHQSFNSVDTIRATGLAKALDVLCKPFMELTGININPVKVTLTIVEMGACKKAETGCRIL